MSRLKRLNEWLKWGNREGRGILGDPRCQLGRGDLLFLDRMIHEHPEWRTFVEIGTGSGLTSCYLGMIAHLRAGYVHSFDIKTPFYRRFMPCHVFYHQVDVFSDEGRSLVDGALAQGPALLICDGGDKPQEVATFSGSVRKGSALVVHDYPNECGEDDVAVLDSLGYVPVLHEWAQDCLSKFRAWERV